MTATVGRCWPVWSAPWYSTCAVLQPTVCSRALCWHTTLHSPSTMLESVCTVSVASSCICSTAARTSSMMLFSRCSYRPVAFSLLPSASAAAFQRRVTRDRIHLLARWIFQFVLSGAWPVSKLLMCVTAVALMFQSLASEKEILGEDLERSFSGRKSRRVTRNDFHILSFLNFLWNEWPYP